MSEHLGRELLPTELVCHHCDNRACFEISHLYVGSHTDNMRDMASRGRSWMQVLKGNYPQEIRDNISKAAKNRCANDNAGL